MASCACRSFCQPAYIGDDAGDVGGCRERANAHPAQPLRGFQQGFQRGEVYPAIAAELDPDYFGHAFTPAQLVGMVLIRADEDDRACRGQMGVQSRFLPLPPARR